MAEPTPAAAHRRPWTRQQHDELDALLAAGYSDAQIARRLGRTADAVKVRRKRLGLAPVRARWLSPASVGQRLGVDAGTVRRWCGARLVHARRGPPSGGTSGARRWLISEQAVFDFLANPATWTRWQLDRITERDWWWWAREHRQERYLRLSEVAARYHVEAATVWTWIAAGQLRAVRVGRGNHRVPESALAGWTPPYARSRAGMARRPFTAVEDATLLARREAGATWREISEPLGRRGSTVRQRYRRLRPDAVG